ncbi:hypothetical protein Tter_1262 [Thermobaculum terrenum ATCC BAA-798]|uniref:YtxH domain-containing protein n=1 Tax=Thermobaculum terrenum (strain ATCC BAA-798 / CCMEE 7001 / YNP1) TaxID=525904 RepID=D1CBK5_THET1|nr:YtxH domain-containing protein [Thermobaculum terrenum]ACZ42170.1 hypothetical protein Tter_1262 [Thermobaculum terrenum ATCC BAA-798]
MSKLITAIKWFVYGLTFGILFAPRSGRETRAQIVQWLTGYVSDVLDASSQTIDRTARRTQEVVEQAQRATERAGEKAESMQSSASENISNASEQIRHSGPDTH